MGLKIGIIGSRRRDTQEDFVKVEDMFFSIFEPGAKVEDEIVSGGCPEGGDHFAELIAKEHQITIKIWYAKWRKYGKGAGYVRNGNIAKDSDILIACVAADRKGGTEDAIKKFLKLRSKNCLFLV